MELTEWIIHMQDLSKNYRQGPALKSLELKVAPHSIFGFLGPNGAGKTTTIKLLLGLIKPTSGAASLFGLELGVRLGRHPCPDRVPASGAALL